MTRIGKLLDECNFDFRNIFSQEEIYSKNINKLLKIAKKKKLLLAEATLFNYHRVFDIIKKLCKGFNQVEHIQSNLNHPLIRSTKEIEKTFLLSNETMKDYLIEKNRNIQDYQKKFR